MFMIRDYKTNRVDLINIYMALNVGKQVLNERLY